MLQRIASFLIVLFVAACGFAPMHGRGAGQDGAGGGGAPALHYADIQIDTLKDRDGQFLRNALIDRLHPRGANAAPSYILRIDPLTRENVSLGVRRDATFTRADIRFAGTMQLIDRATGQVLMTRAVRQSGGHNLLDNQFATLVSRESVAEDILNGLADVIVGEIDLYFSRAGHNAP